MRLLIVTAGAGGMYCGSCLRDNALATELIARKHDVTLLPVYTPTLTDEPNVSGERVFFGGVSVYLQQHVPLFRHTPDFLDKLWDSPALIRAVSGRGVSTDPKLLGELTVSMLKGEDGFQAKELRKMLDWLRTLPPYDAVNLPNALLLGMAPSLRRERLGPLVCTLQGEDLFLEALQEPYRSQSMALIRRLVPEIDAFVSVSASYAAFMTDYLGLPKERVHTVPLGINFDGHTPREPSAAGPFTIGYFARVAPEKGLHLLADAYVRMRRAHGVTGTRLAVAGYLAPEHRPYLARVEADLAAAGLADEYSYAGVLDREQKIGFLRGLDLLSVPSPYVEPKGLYLLEALANGVPAVQPRHGAFPEILDATGGGRLFEPGDADDLARVLAERVRDPAGTARLGAAGADGVRRHYGLPRMADAMERVYASLTSRRTDG
ncbi:MAG: glycosyltransferase family 4 protein [Vicinamibacteria bacterium]